MEKPCVVIKNILFFCITLLPVSTIASNHIIGQYQCTERNLNLAVPPIKSELFISKAKHQYKFVWYYEDSTVYEGLSTSKKDDLLSLTLKYIDMDHVNFTEREPGVEKFLIQDKGQKLIGKFYTTDHTDDGREECTQINI